MEREKDRDVVRWLGNCSGLDASWGCGLIVEVRCDFVVTGCAGFFVYSTLELG